MRHWRNRRSKTSKSMNVVHHMDRMRNKIHTLRCGKNAENTLDKIQHPFMIKTLNRVGMEETQCNIIKAIYDKPAADKALNGERRQFLQCVQEQVRVSSITTSGQHSAGSPSQTDEVRKKIINAIQMGKEEVTLSLSEDDTILYMETN